MDSRPAPSTNHAPGFAPRWQPRSYRHQIQSLSYVILDQANGGIIRNLGDAGIAIQAVTPLYVDQQIFLRFDFTNPRVRIEAKGRVAWADTTGQAGVEFQDLAPRSRRSLKDWIFIQLLRTAEQATGDLTFVYDRSGGQNHELLFSEAPRPAIRLEPERPAVRLSAEDGLPPRTLRLPWFPVALSTRVLSLLVDGLILLSAVLLFAVICMATTGVVPAWPVTVILGVGAAAIFTVLYQFLFLFWIGATPGDWLSGFTGGAFEGINREAEEQPRFR